MEYRPIFTQMYLIECFKVEPPVSGGSEIIYRYMHKIFKFIFKPKKFFWKEKKVSKEFSELSRPIHYHQPPISGHYSRSKICAQTDFFGYFMFFVIISCIFFWNLDMNTYDEFGKRTSSLYLLQIYF